MAEEVCNLLEVGAAAEQARRGRVPQDVGPCPVLAARRPVKGQGHNTTHQGHGDGDALEPSMAHEDMPVGCRRPALAEVSGDGLPDAPGQGQLAGAPSLAGGDAQGGGAPSKSSRSRSTTSQTRRPRWTWHKAIA